VVGGVRPPAVVVEVCDVVVGRWRVCGRLFVSRYLSFGGVVGVSFRISTGDVSPDLRYSVWGF
jgi:hypothetical protein